MTQTQIEQTRVIAEYDGWELIGEPEYNPPFKCYHKGIKVIPVINPQGEEYDGWSTYFPYLTDLNALHKVAMDVMDAIRKSRKEHYQYSVSLILNACWERPINGEYIDLFNAVYEAIVFLNSN